ncbi:MAG: uroporphyrinogen-III synthase [Dokdonella sp.]
MQSEKYDSNRPLQPSLLGASVIVTRPQGSSAELIRAAEARGAGIVRLPGVRIVRVEDKAAAQNALKAAESADHWIFTSPNAVRFSWQLGAHPPRSGALAVLAVGAGTRRALQRHGVSAFAPSGAQNSEGLLADPALPAFNGKSIVIIDAPGGRDLLAPKLRERGARVERIAVYQRLPPRLQARYFSALAQAQRPWISLVSSSVILNNLVAALTEELRQRWQHEALVVSSARLAEEAKQLGFSDVHEARSALSADMLEGAERVLGRHRI